MRMCKILSCINNLAVSMNEHRNYGISVLDYTDTVNKFVWRKG